MAENGRSDLVAESIRDGSAVLGVSSKNMKRRLKRGADDIPPPPSDPTQLQHQSKLALDLLQVQVQAALLLEQQRLDLLNMQDAHLDLQAGQAKHAVHKSGDTAGRAKLQVERSMLERKISEGASAFKSALAVQTQSSEKQLTLVNNILATQAKAAAAWAVTDQARAAGAEPARGPAPGAADPPPGLPTPGRPTPLGGAVPAAALALAPGHEPGPGLFGVGDLSDPKPAPGALQPPGGRLLLNRASGSDGLSPLDRLQTSAPGSPLAPLGNVLLGNLSHSPRRPDQSSRQAPVGFGSPVASPSRGVMRGPGSAPGSVRGAGPGPAAWGAPYSGGTGLGRGLGNGLTSAGGIGERLGSGLGSVGGASVFGSDLGMLPMGREYESGGSGGLTGANTAGQRESMRRGRGSCPECSHLRRTGPPAICHRRKPVGGGEASTESFCPREPPPPVQRVAGGEAGGGGGDVIDRAAAAGIDVWGATRKSLQADQASASGNEAQKAARLKLMVLDAMTKDSAPSLPVFRVFLTKQGLRERMEAELAVVLGEDAAPKAAMAKAGTPISSAPETSKPSQAKEETVEVRSKPVSKGWSGLAVTTPDATPLDEAFKAQKPKDTAATIAKTDRRVAEPAASGRRSASEPAVTPPTPKPKLSLPGDHSFWILELTRAMSGDWTERHQRFKDAAGTPSAASKDGKAEPATASSHNRGKGNGARFRGRGGFGRGGAGGNFRGRGSNKAMKRKARVAQAASNPSK